MVCGGRKLAGIPRPGQGLEQNIGDDPVTGLQPGRRAKNHHRKTMTAPVSLTVASKTLQSKENPDAPVSCPLRLRRCQNDSRDSPLQCLSRGQKLPRRKPVTFLLRKRVSQSIGDHGQPQQSGTTKFSMPQQHYAGNSQQEPRCCRQGRSSPGGPTDSRHGTQGHRQQRLPKTNRAKPSQRDGR